MGEFLVIPAIELRAGMAIRYESVGVGTRADRVEPVSFAQKFVQAGAQMIHLYNLDGPFIVGKAEHSGSVLAGAERNLTVMGEVASTLEVPVQVSGGIRDLESFKVVTQLGVNRAAIGSAAMQDPGLVREAVAFNSDALALFLDVRGDVPVAQRWIEDPKASVEQLATRLREAGAEHLILQDVGADAAGQGPNLSSAGNLGGDVIVTGGVQTLDHIKAAAASEGVCGVLVGKPLMQAAFTYEQALAAAEEGLASRG